MNNLETVLHLVRLIEYIKQQLVLVDSDEALGFSERSCKKEQLRYNLLRANEYYSEITSSHFKKVA